MPALVRPAEPETVELIAKILPLAGKLLVIVGLMPPRLRVPLASLTVPSSTVMLWMSCVPERVTSHCVTEFALVPAEKNALSLMVVVELNVPVGAAPAIPIPFGSVFQNKLVVFHVPGALVVSVAPVPVELMSQ